MGRALTALLLASLAPSVASVGPAQEVGLETMHVPAPEFPSAPGIPAPQTDLAGGSITGSARSAQPGAIVAPNISSPQGGGATANQRIRWINNRPLRMAELRGHVVMIDMWDPTAIGWVRAHWVNNKWWERYHNDGFETVEIESPRFDFLSFDLRAAVKQFGLTWPILINAQFWARTAYKTASWPNRYLIDSNGLVRYHLAGEAHDAGFEQAIQQLLKEAHPDLTFPASYAIPPDQDVFGQACGGAPTPETDVGWYEGHALANPEGYRDRQITDYLEPVSPVDGRVVLQGRWQTNRNGVIYRGTPQGGEHGDSRATLGYHAHEVYGVMESPHRHPLRLYITQDGSHLTPAQKGADVQIDGHGGSYVEVRHAGIYDLVRNSVSSSHVLAIFPTRPGFELYAFTFSNDCQARLDRGEPPRPRELPAVHALPADGSAPVGTAAATFVDMPDADLAKAIPELKSLEQAQSQSLLPEILQRTGATVSAFFDEFPDTTCTERVTSRVRIDYSVLALRPPRLLRGLRDYEATHHYLALTQPGATARLREFRTDSKGRLVPPEARGEIITTGFIAMLEHFHPDLQPESRFRYLGVELVEKQPAYLVAFAERPRVARRFTSIEVGRLSEIAFWQGVAWIDPVSFRIVRLHTDLEPTKGAFMVLKETTDILYSGVSFGQGRTTLWLPREVTVNGQLNQYVFHNEHRYSDYRLFRVTVERHPGS